MFSVSLTYTYRLGDPLVPFTNRILLPHASEFGETFVPNHATPNHFLNAAICEFRSWTDRTIRSVGSVTVLYHRHNVHTVYICSYKTLYPTVKWKRILMLIMCRLGLYFDLTT